MSSILSNGPHIFDVYGNILHKQFEIIAKLNSEEQKNGFAMMEDDMRMHIEFMWNVVNNVKDVPVEYIELCLMMDNLMKALFETNIEVLSGGKRKRSVTRKHGKRGGTRRNTKNTERTFSLLSSIGSKLMVGTALALSAYSGSSVSTGAVNEVAYYSDKTIQGLKNLLPEFVIGQQPIHKNVIPESLMNLAVDYNYKQIHTPAVNVELNSSAAFVFDRNSLQFMQDVTADVFATHVTELLGDPLMTEEFPKIRETVAHALADSEASLATCTTGVPIWKILGDPCKVEKAQHDLEKERKQSMEALGHKLTPGDTLTAKHYSLQPATIGIADGVSQVLSMQGDTESATVIQNMLTTFQGYKGIGLEEGTGRFAPNLLLTKSGVDNAMATCTEAIRKAKCGDSCGEFNPIVSKIENILTDVCDIQVNVYAQKAFANNVARKEGDELVNKMLSIEDMKQKGFNRMIQYFETKSKTSNQHDAYVKIIQDLHFMNLKNIMFPTDPTEVSTWITAIESHYMGYLRAGVTEVETLSTRDFFSRLYAKNVSSTWNIQIAGALAGSAICIALLGLARAAWYGATGTIYAAGAIGQFMKNMYDNQVHNGALANQMYKAKSTLIKNAKSPEQFALAQALLSGPQPIQTLKNIQPKTTIGNMNNKLALSNISGGYRKRRSVTRRSRKSRNASKQ